MKKIYLLCICLGVVFGVNISCALGADQTPKINYYLAYTPGRLGHYGPMMSDFAQKSLLPACKALESQDFSTAKPIFDKAILDEPTNLLAWVGLVQCSESDWMDLYKQYKTDDEKYPSPYHDFKLGLVAYYITFTKATNDQLDGDQKRELQPDIRKVYSAFDKIHSPIIAFAAGGTPEWEESLVFFAGRKTSAQYFKAKADGWKDPVPDVAPENITSLQDLRWLVFALKSSHSGRFVKANGDPVEYTSEQVAARAYLQSWAIKIGHQIIAEGGTPEYADPLLNY